MENQLKIKNYSLNNEDFYLSINNIMSTVIQPGAGFDSITIATNTGFGMNGYMVYLRDKDGNSPTTLEQCQSILEQLKKCLFAKPGVGVVELQGEFNLLDVAEYTQIT
jgi:ABC-type transporter Mla maintaining outer membrane lipid asymmetry ATPase subunit MlaF